MLTEDGLQSPPSSLVRAEDDEPAPAVSPGWAWAVRLLPLVIALPVVAGVAVSFARVFGARHPHLGWAIAIASDAKAVALGTLPYGDPAESYTGLLYAPGFPLLLAPLYRLFWWDGWPLLLSMAAGCVLAGTAGVLATDGRGRSAPERVGEAALALGVAGMAWWAMTANPYNMLDQGRSDHVAWLFALLGLVAVARLVGGASTRTWPAVVLLTAALWTKQTTVAAMLVAGVATTYWIVGGAFPRRTWARLWGGLVLVNVVLLVALQLATRGWAWFFLVTLPARHWRDPAVMPYLRELRDFAALAVGLLAGAAIAALAPVAARRDRLLHRVRALVRTPSSWRGALVVLLALFVVAAFVPAFAARRKQGGEANQYIGMLWALAFLYALAYRAARRTQVGAVVLVLMLATAVTAAHVQPVRRLAGPHVEAASPYAPMRVFTVEPTFVARARVQRIYLPLAGDLGAEHFREVWPTEQNIVDLYAAGTEPGHLVQALLDQHFDVVSLFDPTSDPYASAYGRTEENVLWKLNRVMVSGYEPFGGHPLLLYKRPGGLAEPWLRTCFGPFRMGGTEWAVYSGGGLWCRKSETVVALEETPAARSELRAPGARRVAGEIAVEFRSGQGGAAVAVGGGRTWTAVVLTALPGGAGVRAKVARAGGGATSVDVPLATPGRTVVTIVFEDGPVTPGRLPVGTPSGRGISVHADAESRLSVDVARLRAAG